MSHIAQSKLRTATLLAVLMASTTSFTAQAAMTNASIERWGAKTQSSATLSEFIKTEDRVILDWRNPAHTLQFNIPDTDFIPSLRLSLSADPVSRKSRKASLYVQFNQDTPVEIKSNGRGFDAQLNLDPALIRSQRNTLRIFMTEKDIAPCQTNKGWVVDLAASKLTMKKQAKTRNYKIRDFETTLQNPLTAPKTVGIYALGSEASSLHALIAQAVGHRMDTPPNFTTLQGRGDVQVIAGRRDVIAKTVRNKTILQGAGARLVMDASRPMRVILTGDTDDEVLAIARAFSQYKLPDTVRQQTNIGELKMQTAYSSDSEFIVGKTKLAAIGSTAFEPGWAPQDEVIKFDVRDPQASQGEIVLNLANSDNAVSADNKVSFSLNNYSLGQIKLQGKRQKVALKIPASILKGQNNELRLSADLNPKKDGACNAATVKTPNIYFKSNSYIKLDKAGDTPLTDLSRFTASGVPFSDKMGQNTVIVLPRNNVDFNAALGLLAQMAETHANGWLHASFVRGAQNLNETHKSKNILFVTPSNELPSLAKAAAPLTARTALKGQTSSGENLLPSQAQQYASLNARDAYRQSAQKVMNNKSIHRGGLATLYGSPYQSNKIVGLITNVPGQSFAKSLQTLRRDSHWNAIEGSVARWNTQSVLMTELASDLGGFAHLEERSPARQSKWALPEIGDLSDRLPEFDLPSVNVAGIKDKLMFWKSDVSIDAPSAIPDQPVQQVAVEPFEKTSFEMTASKMPEEAVKEVELRFSSPTIFKAEAKPTLRPLSSSKPNSFLDTVLPDATVRAKDAKAFTTAVTAPISGRISEVNQRLEGKSVTPGKSALDMVGDALPKLEKQTQSFHFGPLQDKTAQALKWSGEKWENAKQGVANMKLGKDVNNLQKSVSPIGNSWKQQLRGVSLPGQSMAKWSVQKLSAAALLLILMFGVVIFFLGASDAQSRTGHYH